MPFYSFGKVPPGTILQQQRIPRTDTVGLHPHDTDVYIPRGSPKHALVILHGGGGSKRSQAVFCRTLKTRNLILTPEDVNWKRLSYFGCIEVYPLGQRCLPSNAVDNPWNPNGVDSRVAKRPDGVTAWSQGYFWSGANDPQFLRDLATWILNEFPSVDKVHIHGHSAGGMMAKYMWRFEPDVFDHHSTCSGPTPFYWDATPFAPSVVKPMWMQMGRKDEILGLLGGVRGPGDHWGDFTWSQQPEQLSFINVKGVTNPITGQWIPQLQEIIPEWREIQRGITAYNAANSLPAETWTEGAAVIVPQKTGNLKTWTYSNGRMVLRLLSEAGHQYYRQQAEMMNPTTGGGVAIVSEVMKWVLQTPT